METEGWLNVLINMEYLSQKLLDGRRTYKYERLDRKAAPVVLTRKVFVLSIIMVAALLTGVALLSG